MLIARFLAVVTVAMSLAPIASALPYELAAGSNTRLTIRVTASDGFTTETAIDVEPKATDFGGASSEAFVQGILTPVLFAENLDVFYDPMTFDGTIGVTNIPVSITFDDVSLSYEPLASFGTLNPDGAALGGQENIVASALSGLLSGSLNADGVVVPFSFSSANFCVQQAFGCWPGTGSNDPSRPKVRPFNNFDQFTLGGGSFTGMRTIVVDRETIADVGGITYQLEVAAWASGSSMKLVPEPSAGLLLGGGLLALGLRRRDRNLTLSPECSRAHGHALYSESAGRDYSLPAGTTLRRRGQC